jgi:acyl-CoA reductase-like NAD-dependent aldehyde dehydrogenase
VRPTLFADVKPDHRLAQEEIFGPVQVVIAFEPPLLAMPMLVVVHY